jgi:hypothetical protein
VIKYHESEDPTCGKQEETTFTKIKQHIHTWLGQPIGRLGRKLLEIITVDVGRLKINNFQLTEI